MRRMHSPTLAQVASSRCERRGGTATNQRAATVQRDLEPRLPPARARGSGARAQWDKQVFVIVRLLASSSSQVEPPLRMPTACQPACMPMAAA